MGPASEIQSRLDFAVEAARAAGEITLRYFRRADLAVERKADDSPVTLADREAEAYLRDGDPAALMPLGEGTPNFNKRFG